MKTCDTCKRPLPPSEFNKNCRRADGLQSICMECSNARSRRYYAEKGEVHRDNVRRINTTQREALREKMLEYLESHPCQDCGNTDVRVLEFDHRDPSDKADDVSALMRKRISWALILNEISKCDVVCANCHRIRTAVMFPSYRTRCRTV